MSGMCVVGVSVRGLSLESLLWAAGPQMNPRLIGEG